MKGVDDDDDLFQNDMARQNLIVLNRGHDLPRVRHAAHFKHQLPCLRTLPLAAAVIADPAKESDHLVLPIAADAASGKNVQSARSRQQRVVDSVRCDLVHDDMGPVEGLDEQLVAKPGAFPGAKKTAKNGQSQAIFFNAHSISIGSQRIERHACEQFDLLPDVFHRLADLRLSHPVGQLNPGLGSKIPGRKAERSEKLVQERGPGKADPQPRVRRLAAGIRPMPRGRRKSAS